MAECSVCSRGEEAATIVNELLFAKTKLRDIETQVGVGFRSVSRHSQPNARCPFSFTRFKAARIRNKGARRSGRWIVQWADGSYSIDGETVPASAIRADDAIFVVVYRETPVDHFKNPRALAPTSENIAALHLLAVAEDSQRTNAHIPPNAS